MTDDDEEFLTQLYQSLSQRALVDPADPRYVPFVEDGSSGGEDVIAQLAKEIRWAAPGSAFFLTGTRGTGKSTQMRRLQRELEHRGFVALWLEAEDYLNLQIPINVVEFLFFLAGGVSDAVRERKLLPQGSPLDKAWHRLRTWLRNLPSRVELEGVDFSASVGFSELIKTDVGIKAAIRKDESFVAQLRDFLDGRLAELVDEVNKMVDETVDALRTEWSIHRTDPFRGVVLLIDSIDHSRGIDFSKNRQALTDLFDKQLESISISTCRSVFVIPPYLSVEFGTKRALTNVAVTDKNGVENPGALDSLRELVRRRFPHGQSPSRLLGPDEVDRLIRLSGGHLRDLLRMLIEVSVRVNALPVTAAVVDQAVRQVRQGLLPIADDEALALTVVRDTHQLPLADQAAWEAVAGLWDRHLILGYQNGELWYGVHPLVVDRLPTKPVPPPAPGS